MDHIKNLKGHLDMAESASENQNSGAAGESFAALLDESLGQVARLEGSVLRGTVVAIEGDAAVIDVGLKSEGRVPLKEFSEQGRAPEVKVGDSVEVYLERMENKNGEALISRDKAKREESWTQLEKSFADNERVTGVIFGRVKGGFTVDLSGAVAFLPGSQVDIRPVRDVGPLMGTPQPFQILKMDRARGNIVVSRRAVLEETRAEQRSELISGLSEGQVLDGVVKNITDYGAFVDLGGVDGLLHVTDISWKRIGHPAEALTIGQQVKVQVIRFNSRPLGRRGRQVSCRRKVHRPCHKHHRLRRLRGTGGGHRGPGPRFRNVLDKEEHPPRQDCLHEPGSGSHGARR
jgi:small subunit ribosomal protein S1